MEIAKTFNRSTRPIGARIMKNITVSVSDQAYRQARIWAAERGTSISRVVQYFISTLPGLKPAARKFPLPDESAKSSDSLAPLASSAQKPPFPVQNSARKPAFCRIFPQRS
jgi:hypothetical protein